MASNHLSGWKSFFLSSWTRFDTRFKTILESLARHADLVDKEAVSISIIEAKAWRERAIEESQKRDAEKAAVHRQMVINWLRPQDFLQEDELVAQLDRGHEGSCSWIVQNSTFQAWKRLDTQSKVIWLKGKPGSGRTQYPTLYCFGTGMLIFNRLSR